jgi:hypothetical protein
MKTRMYVLVVALGLTLGLFTVADAKAEAVTFEFEGKVSFIDQKLTKHFKRGQKIHGRYTFESSTVGIQPNPFNLHFVDYHALKYAEVFVHGPPAYLDYVPDFGAIRVTDNNYDPTNDFFFGDQYQVVIPLTGAPVKGIPISFIVITLDDSTGTALTSLALPDTPPPLSSFDNNTFQLTYEDSTDPLNLIDYNVQGYITKWKRLP